MIPTIGAKTPMVAQRSRVKYADLAVKADGRSGHQGLAVSHARGVDRLPGDEVVAAVEHHIAVWEKLLEQSSIGAAVDGGHRRVRVDRGDGAARRVDLGKTDAVHSMGYLALQVGQFDPVVVDQRDTPHARSAKVHGYRTAQTACPYDQRVGAGNTILPIDADFIKQEVARVAQQLVVCHGGLGVGGHPGLPLTAQGAVAPIVRRS